MEPRPAAPSAWSVLADVAMSVGRPLLTDMRRFDAWSGCDPHAIHERADRLRMTTQQWSEAMALSPGTWDGHADNIGDAFALPAPYVVAVRWNGRCDQSVVDEVMRATRELCGFWW